MLRHCCKHSAATDGVERILAVQLQCNVRGLTLHTCSDSMANTLGPSRDSDTQLYRGEVRTHFFSQRHGTFGNEPQLDFAYCYWPHTIHSLAERYEATGPQSLSCGQRPTENGIDELKHCVHALLAPLRHCLDVFEGPATRPRAEPRGSSWITFLSTCLVHWGGGPE